MKERLKLASKILVLPLLVCALFVDTEAQRSRETYTISARAGGVNFLSGNVTVRRQGANQTESLRASDNLRSGDTVITGADGRVEILLNPGSYLRVAENSEIELTETSLDDLRFRLVRGDAIIEATGTAGDRPAFEIATPQTRVAIIRDGLYRIVARRAPNNSTDVFVRRGRALVVGTGATELLRAGKHASITGNSPVVVASFDRDNKDAFDYWSKERAEELARINRRLSNRSMRSALASLNRGFWEDSFGGGFGRYAIAGVWVYSTGCATFVPFYSGFSSPYGGSYWFSLSPFMSSTCCLFPMPANNNQSAVITMPPSGGGSGGGGGVVRPVEPPTNPRFPSEPSRPMPIERQAPIERPIERPVTRDQ
jgi:environmental stress-induced protein Ves